MNPKYYSHEKYERYKESHKARMARYLAKKKEEKLIANNHPIKLQYVTDARKKGQMRKVFNYCVVKVDTLKLRELEPASIENLMKHFIDERAHHFVDHPEQLKLLKEFIKNRITDNSDMTAGLKDQIEKHKYYNKHVATLTQMDRYIKYTYNLVYQCKKRGMSKEETIERLNAYMEHREFSESDKQRAISILESHFS